MKKFLCVLIAMLALSFVACGGNGAENDVAEGQKQFNEHFREHISLLLELYTDHLARSMDDSDFLQSLLGSTGEYHVISESMLADVMEWLREQYELMGNPQTFDISDLNDDELLIISENFAISYKLVARLHFILLVEDSPDKSRYALCICKFGAKVVALALSVYH